MTSYPLYRFSEPVLRRICGEFTEMPGLRLTRKQAERLWGLDEGTCARILEFLVEHKFLHRTSADTYGRTTDGPVAFPQLRRAMAKAEAARHPPLAMKRAI